MANSKIVRYWPLWLILIILLLPYSLARVLHSYVWHTVQYGSLVQPPILLQSALLQPKKWNIVYRNSYCQQNCQERYQLLRNVPKALGNKQHLVAVVEGGVPDDLFLASDVLLVDSRQYLVMHYASNQEVGKVFKDLKQLLRYNLASHKTD